MNSKLYPIPPGLKISFQSLIITLKDVAPPQLHVESTLSHTDRIYSTGLDCVAKEVSKVVAFKE